MGSAEDIIIITLIVLLLAVVGAEVSSWFAFHPEYESDNCGECENGYCPPDKCKYADDPVIYKTDAKKFEQTMNKEQSK